MFSAYAHFFDRSILIQPRYSGFFILGKRASLFNYLSDRDMPEIEHVCFELAPEVRCGAPAPLPGVGHVLTT